MSVNLCLQTYDVYTVSQESSLLYFLDGGIQEEVLLPIGQILDYLEGTPEYDTFVEAINPNAVDCLLTREW